MRYYTELLSTVLDDVEMISSTTLNPIDQLYRILYSALLLKMALEQGVPPSQETSLQNCLAEYFRYYLHPERLANLNYWYYFQLRPALFQCTYAAAHDGMLYKKYKGPLVLSKLFSPVRSLTVEDEFSDLNGYLLLQTFKTFNQTSVQKKLSSIGIIHWYYYLTDPAEKELFSWYQNFARPLIVLHCK